MATTIEKISIALPPEMVVAVRSAVETGEYASNSEVVRDALRDWTYKRQLRQQGLAELKQIWQQALDDTRPTFSIEEVFEELEHDLQIVSGSSEKIL